MTKKKRGEYDPEYYQKNKERILGSVRRYKQKIGIEKFREWESNYKRGNQHFLAKRREYYQKNKIKFKARSKVQSAIKKGILKRNPCEVSAVVRVRVIFCATPLFSTWK